MRAFDGQSDARMYPAAIKIKINHFRKLLSQIIGKLD